MERPRLKQQPPGYCCPFCAEPVGYVGRFFAWVFGGGFHGCDYSNVAKPVTMKMPVDKEWFAKRAAAEGDLEIGAGPMGAMVNPNRAAIRAVAFEEAAHVAYRVCAETRHVTLGDKAAVAIRALSAPETGIPLHGCGGWMFGRQDVLEDLERALSYPVSTEIAPNGYGLRHSPDDVGYAMELIRDALAQRPLYVLAQSKAIEALETENTRLREALEPFAREGEKWSTIFGDALVPNLTPSVTEACDREPASFTVGDLRRATSLRDAKGGNS